MPEQPIENANPDDISEFLFDNFQEAPGISPFKGEFTHLMDQYTALAKFLSDKKKFRQAAAELSLLLEKYYRDLTRQFPGERFPLC